MVERSQHTSLFKIAFVDSDPSAALAGAEALTAAYLDRSESNRKQPFQLLLSRVALPRHELKLKQERSKRASVR